MVVGSLFGTSCMPILRFVQPPPPTFSKSIPLSFTISLSIRQPVDVRLLLVSDDLKPHKRLAITPQQQCIRFVESTIYKFEGLYINEIDSSQSMDSAILSAPNTNNLNETSQLQEEQHQEFSGTGEYSNNTFNNEAAPHKGDSARIMVEACTPSASATLLSDTITEDNDPIVVVEITHQLVEASNHQQTVWVLLNKEPTELSIALSDNNNSSIRPIDEVKLYGKLVIFTLPQLDLNTDATQALEANLNGNETILEKDGDSESNIVSNSQMQEENVIDKASESSDQCTTSDKQQLNAEAQQSCTPKDVTVDAADAVEASEIAKSAETTETSEVDAQKEVDVREADAEESNEVDIKEVDTEENKEVDTEENKEVHINETKEVDTEETKEVDINETKETDDYKRPSNDWSDWKIFLQCGKQQIQLPITFKHNDMHRSNEQQLEAASSERAAQLTSLFSFACGGDPLALLYPLTSLLGETDSDGCNALHLSARNKQNFALKTLLTALRDSNDTDRISCILNARNKRGQTPLHCAVHAGDADCVHYLLRAGALNNIPDNNFNTVIHYLGEAYNDAIYKEILEQLHSEQSDEGDTITSNVLPSNQVENALAAKNSDGYTPAHIAVHKLKLSLLEALIEVNAPVDLADENGETPLLSAVLMDDLDIATLLLANKCNPNVISKQNDTPLGIACRRKNLVLIGRLIDAGADVNLPDKYGNKPSECDDEEVQKILNGERIQPSPPTVQCEPITNTNNNGPCEGTSANGANNYDDDALLAYRMRAINRDDVSSLDFLTRLRLAKLLDTDEKWITLADHLGCAHMVEFIRVCTDDASSPTMILLDQYEQLPNANLATVAESLEDMGETIGVRLLKAGNEQEEQNDAI